MSTGNDQSSPLFSPTPVVGDAHPAPAIVVGLPRSGSSYLSHVLSQIRGWYVFDDLYLYRNAQSLGANGPLTPEQLEKLIYFLGWQIRARINWGSFDPPRCTLDDVDRMDEALRQTFASRPVTWHELLEEWMTRLAQHHGCGHWGYKAPQDFMHIPMLRKLFPGAKFIYIHRDPRAVMASFKYIKGDGHPGQYHPIVYARYWRLAAEIIEEAQRTMPEDILPIRFEDLASKPNEEAERIADFLGSQLTKDVSRADRNTSFDAKERKAITPTEEWLCTKIAGRSMARLDYEASSKSARLRDIPDLLSVTMRFATYQSYRLLTNPAGRQSIATFLGTVLKKARPRS